MDYKTYPENCRITKLKIEIACARTKLQDLWNNYGYTNTDLLAAGDHIDSLMNEYHKLLQEDNK